jgi:hypothetical protein
VRLGGNPGEPIGGVEGAAYPRTRVKSEDEGGSGRKSEAPIRAMNPGNVGEAKGWRFEITGEGDMARYWAEYDHDNTIGSFHTEKWDNKIGLYGRSGWGDRGVVRADRSSGLPAQSGASSVHPPKGRGATDRWVSPVLRIDSSRTG